MKQIDGSRSQTFGVSCGKLCGASNGGLHLQGHVEQGATGEVVLKTGQRCVALARNVLALARSIERR